MSEGRKIVARRLRVTPMSEIPPDPRGAPRYGLICMAPHEYYIKDRLYPGTWDQRGPYRNRDEAVLECDRLQEIEYQQSEHWTQRIKRR